MHTCDCYALILQGADGMERATKVCTVVFDKTGTLTIGKPTVLEHCIFDPQAGTSFTKRWDPQDVLQGYNCQRTCAPCAQTGRAVVVGQWSNEGHGCRHNGKCCICVPD